MHCRIHVPCLLRIIVLCLLFAAAPGGAAAGEGRLLAALSETEGPITFRGGKPLHLPLPLLKVHVRSEGDDTAKGLLALALRDLAVPVENPSQAAVLLSLSAASQAGCLVRVSDAGGADLAGGRRFSLPAESGALRGFLWSQARYHGLRALKGDMPFPDLDWDIHLYRPATEGGDGAVSANGRLWRPASVLTLRGSDTLQRLDGPALLLFSFTNKTRDNYYVYLINYTDDGQIVPVLPPLGGAEISTAVPWGKELQQPALRLELEAPVERLKLVISRVPLDISVLAREEYVHADDADILKSKDWCSVEAVFLLPR